MSIPGDLQPSKVAHVNEQFLTRSPLNRCGPTGKVRTGPE